MMVMKKIYIIFTAMVLSVVGACERNPVTVPLADVRVNVYFDGSLFPENATVTLRAQHHSISYEDVSRGGFATFSVPVGQYSISVLYRGAENDEIIIYNGTASAVMNAGTENVVNVDLTESRSSQLVIKELYVGGCQNDEGSGYYQYDKYLILYNNGATEFDASNIAFAIAAPYNSNSSNRYLVNGELSYASQGWIPASSAIWWFETDVVIPPYSQIVISVFGGIDHTATYSNSVDLSHPEYYVMYDVETTYNNAIYYPAPSSNIPVSHYLRTYPYAQGNAWPLSNNSPAFFILEQDNIESFVTDVSNYDYTESNTRPNVKIPVDWVVDAVEVFVSNVDMNNKRFTSTLDAGYVYHRTQYGYSVYRNVDQVATEALPENEGLLVYGYSGGTDSLDASYGSTDPSGIDAEASIANGAHIVYQDTNNSSNDFHMRAEASLRF